MPCSGHSRLITYLLAENDVRFSRGACLARCSRATEWMAISNLTQHLPVRLLWVRSLLRGNARFPSLGGLLSSYRNYLLTVAGSEIGRDLRSKVSPSDLVQETCLEASRDFASFTGRPAEEFQGWLRRVLLNNLANEVRRFRSSEKRGHRRAIDFHFTEQFGRYASHADFDTPRISSRSFDFPWSPIQWHCFV